MIRRCLLLWLVSTSLATTSSAAVFTVTTNADSGAGSLRQAILDANATPAVDAIHFNIGGGGPQTITPDSELPAVTAPVTINGTTQPGFTGTPLVTLSGQNAGSANGLTIGSPAPTIVAGLAIVGFEDAGIEVSSDGVRIVGNVIGVDASGTLAVPNGSSGIVVSGGDDNVIGGTLPGEGNVISGNGRSGIVIRPALGNDATGNLVQGNFIGTNAAGTAAIPNAEGGVSLGGAKSTTVGGTASGAGNVISGNGSAGVSVTATCFFTSPFTCVASADTVIAGNFIGTNAAGTQDLGNADFGIDVLSALRTTIGGNVVSGNDDGGIRINSTSAIGGVDGISVDTIITGNLIGTNAAGTAAIPNGGDGVTLTGVQDNTIGGSAAGDGNVIRFNTAAGIRTFGGDGNQFLGNSIDQNGLLGIDLAGDGVTPNDPLDADTGSNGLQNFPLLTSALVTGSTTVTGTLNSTPARTFRIEFFSSPAADPSGFGEGRTFLGFTQVTTDVAGNAAIAATLPAVAVGSVITATATDLTS